MEYLVKDEQLELKYVPGKGAWTYHIQIPNTKHIVGKWGFLKVSGFIDDYKLEAKNLFTISGQDKLLSINNTIRKAINKNGGDIVNVSLYLLITNDVLTKEVVTKEQIIETFKESGILDAFNILPQKEKDAIVQIICTEKTEEKQINLIVQYINKFSK